MGSSPSTALAASGAQLLAPDLQLGVAHTARVPAQRIRSAQAGATRCSSLSTCPQLVGSGLAGNSLRPEGACMCPRAAAFLHRCVYRTPHAPLIRQRPAAPLPAVYTAGRTWRASCNRRLTDDLQRRDHAHDWRGHSGLPEAAQGPRRVLGRWARPVCTCKVALVGPRGQRMTIRPSTPP